MKRESVSAGRSGKAGVLRLVLPAGILAFCFTAFWLTTQFDRVPPILKRGIQPSDFPQLVIGLIAFLCVVMILSDRSAVPEKLPPVVWKTIGLLIGFVLVTKVDLFLGLGVFAITLSALWGERRAEVLAALGIGMPLVVFFLFDIVFQIRFPRGLLTSLWYG